MSFAHDVGCTLRLVLWVFVFAFWVRESKRAGDPDGRFGSRGGGCVRLYPGLPIIKPQPPFLLGSWSRRPVSRATRNGTAKRGKPIPHVRWTGAVHLVLEPDAYTVSGGHDGCIWTPFPVTAQPGRGAKFDLLPAPPCTTRLALLNLVLLAQQSRCLLELGRGFRRVFVCLDPPRDSCQCRCRTNVVIRVCR